MNYSILQCIKECNRIEYAHFNIHLSITSQSNTVKVTFCFLDVFSILDFPDMMLFGEGWSKNAFSGVLFQRVNVNVTTSFSVTFRKTYFVVCDKFLAIEQ